MMGSQAWLDSSLRRSASLGLEVLERASRRSVDWTGCGASQSGSATDEDTRIHVKRSHNELHDAFAAVTEFMAQTTCVCKRFYESGCCAEPNDAERTHVSRFHRQAAAVRTTPAEPSRTRAHVSTAGEDFYMEVAPGTYVVTASLPESQRQTQLVRVKAGESVNLTFIL
ncbi:A-kinase-interacting protein 1 [Betta splendens]|uniref:A-kinase-interacting protein 1 n=1 Tax=Betta splendens TaxID=158456 RepID=A0A6P7MX87_BETSP|nr:A-kinase-interacting protein 1 [Betta splendens]